MKHSRLPPSSAFRWSKCTASIKFVEDNLPTLPDGDSVYADEGTRAHTCLTNLLNGEPYTPDNIEMTGVILKARDRIRHLVQSGDKILVDQQIPLFYLPSQTGTMDVGLISRDRAGRVTRVVIWDLKYGVGVSVDAVENEQIASYAESQVRLLEMIDEVDAAVPIHMEIFQPRDRNNPEPVREWIITREQLKAFVRPIQSAADLILRGGAAEFWPGSPCKFCRATGICKAYATQGLQALSDEPVDTIIASQRGLTQLTSPNLLTHEQRDKVLAAKKTLIAWLEAVENQEMAELLAGRSPGAFKLVAGKSPGRVWNDEKKAKELLLQMIAPELVEPPVVPTLVSPTQAEKLLKGSTVSAEYLKALSAVVDKPEGKPTLVPVDDKRPALVINPTEGLRNLDTESDASALI